MGPVCISQNTLADQHPWQWWGGRGDLMHVIVVVWSDVGCLDPIPIHKMVSIKSVTAWQLLYKRHPSTDSLEED